MPMYLEETICSINQYLRELMHSDQTDLKSEHLSCQSYKELTLPLNLIRSVIETYLATSIEMTKHRYTLYTFLNFKHDVSLYK